MANENKKDFNAMLHDNKDMPKIQTITDRASIEKYGGDRMYFAPPIYYDEGTMKKPFVISISGLSGSGKTAVTNALRAQKAVLYSTADINFQIAAITHESLAYRITFRINIPFSVSKRYNPPCFSTIKAMLFVPMPSL